MDFFNVHAFMPDLDENPEAVKQLACHPRFIKTHSPFRPDLNNVIYLVRNGRDVAVSYYHFYIRTKKVPKNFTFAAFADAFAKGRVGYGLWNNHVESWLENPPSRFLLVRYEDVKAKPVDELVRICNFAKIKVDLPRLRSAVEASSFENMAKLDAAQPRRGIVPKEKNEMFVREGGTNYSSYFDEAMNAEFLKAHGAAMRRLGYL